MLTLLPGCKVSILNNLQVYSTHENVMISIEQCAHPFLVYIDYDSVSVTMFHISC